MFLAMSFGICLNTMCHYLLRFVDWCLAIIFWDAFSRFLVWCLCCVFIWVCQQFCRLAVVLNLTIFSIFSCFWWLFCILWWTRVCVCDICWEILGIVCDAMLNNSFVKKDIGSGSLSIWLFIIGKVLWLQAILGLFCFDKDWEVITNITLIFMNFPLRVHEDCRGTNW